jgi:hypothetical protein
MNRYTHWNFVDDIGAMPILCLGCLVPKIYKLSTDYKVHVIAQYLYTDLMR